MSLEGVKENNPVLRQSIEAVPSQAAPVKKAAAQAPSMRAQVIDGAGSHPLGVQGERIQEVAQLHTRVASQKVLKEHVTGSSTAGLNGVASGAGSVQGAAARRFSVFSPIGEDEDELDQMDSLRLATDHIAMAEGGLMSPKSSSTLLRFRGKKARELFIRDEDKEKVNNPAQLKVGDFVLFPRSKKGGESAEKLTPRQLERRKAEDAREKTLGQVVKKEGEKVEISWAEKGQEMVKEVTASIEYDLEKVKAAALKEDILEPLLGLKGEDIHIEKRDRSLVRDPMDLQKGDYVLFPRSDGSTRLGRVEQFTPTMNKETATAELLIRVFWKEAGRDVMMKEMGVHLNNPRKAIYLIDNAIKKEIEPESVPETPHSSPRSSVESPKSRVSEHQPPTLEQLDDLRERHKLLSTSALPKDQQAFLELQVQNHLAPFMKSKPGDPIRTQQRGALIDTVYPLMKGKITLSKVELEGQLLKVYIIEAAKAHNVQMSMSIDHPSSTAIDIRTGAGQRFIAEQTIPQLQLALQTDFPGLRMDTHALSQDYQSALLDIIDQQIEVAREHASAPVSKMTRIEKRLFAEVLNQLPPGTDLAKVEEAVQQIPQSDLYSLEELANQQKERNLPRALDALKSSKEYREMSEKTYLRAFQLISKDLIENIATRLKASRSPRSGSSSPKSSLTQTQSLLARAVISKLPKDYDRVKVENAIRQIPQQGLQNLESDINQKYREMHAAADEDMCRTTTDKVSREAFHAVSGQFVKSIADGIKRSSPARGVGETLQREAGYGQEMLIHQTLQDQDIQRLSSAKAAKVKEIVLQMDKGAIQTLIKRTRQQFSAAFEKALQNLNPQTRARVESDEVSYEKLQDAVFNQEFKRISQDMREEVIYRVTGKTKSARRREREGLK